MLKLLSLAENYNANSRKRNLVACTSAFLAIFIVAVRRIDQILNPQLWAEDGVIFLQQQLSLGLGAIFTPYAGYLHLLPRLNAFLIDKFIGLEYVPAGYVAGALLIIAIGSIFVALARLPWPAGPLFALATAMVPHGGEVFLNITNVQWMVAPLLMVIAIQDEPRNRRCMAIDLTAVSIVGLTGPFILFMAPFIAARMFWQERSRYNVALAITAFMAAGIQIVFIFHSNQNGAENNLSSAMIPNILSNFWSGLLLGFVTQLPVGFRLFGLVLISLMICMVWLSLPNQTKVFTAMFLTVGILVFAAAVKKLGAISESIHPVGAGQRYFYIPYVLISWGCVLGVLQARKPANWIAIALVLMIIASTGRSFQAPSLPDMEWRKHVALLGTDPLQIPINPTGWFVTIRR
ncbi:hypothetical protein GGE65_005120 [Skermanella aerolata]|uniref:hypothetical protein n=1 Tax=Skermanella aerolata TaxID=393310 RepID=UPI003D25C58F